MPEAIGGRPLHVFIPNSDSAEGPASVDDDEPLVVRFHHVDEGDAPLPGAGAMHAHLVDVGPGEQRRAMTSAAASFRKESSDAGSVFRGVVRAVANGVGFVATTLATFNPITPAIHQFNKRILQPELENRFRAANVSMLGRLEQPVAGSLAADAAVQVKLIAHAAGQNCPLTPMQIRAFVASGEKIARALLAAGADATEAEVDKPDMPLSPASPVTVLDGGGPVTVHSSLYTARALAWYTMACAAEQDLHEEALAGDGNAGPGNMATSGSFVMKDPGNAICRFLAAAPTCGERLSTHFAERSDSPRVAILDQPLQSGIEDYRMMMPGKGGTLLFDRLKPGADGTAELFVKFESAGCPPVFRSEKSDKTASGKVLSKIERVTSLFSAKARLYEHALKFGMSTHAGNAGASVTRQETVNKGKFAKKVKAPFKDLMTSALRLGLIDKKQMARQSQIVDFGLASIEETLTHIHTGAERRLADALQRPLYPGGEYADLVNVIDSAVSLQETIDAARGALGAVSDRHGIARRAAEVHLDLGRSAQPRVRFHY